MLTSLKMHNRIGREVSIQIYMELYDRAEEFVSPRTHDQADAQIEYSIEWPQAQEPLIAALGESL